MSFNNFVKREFSWYFSRKAMPYWCVLLADSLIVVASLIFAHILNYGIENSIEGFNRMMFAICIYLICYYVAFRLFRTYKGVVRYSSFVDLLHLVGAIILGTSLVEALRLIMHSNSFVHDALSGKDLIAGSLIAIILMWLMRMVIKVLYDNLFVANSAPRALIVGTRSAGVGIAKSIRTTNPSPYIVSGFLTDDPEVAKYKLLNLPVLYAQDDQAVIDFVKDHKIGAVLVSPMLQDYFVNNCQVLIDNLLRYDVKIKMYSQEQEWDGKSDVSHESLNEISVEQLLPRKKIEIDMNAIATMLKGRRVLITGAAGSIGYEMVRQIAKFDPEEMILIDQAESPMHNVRLHMERRYPHLKVWTIVGSISNQSQMEALFEAHRPEYVFHAAAYKHVPMMEDNPAIAVQNNIYGTRVIADLAVKYGTLKFVMISTDKAVNPTNVMGCSKRICEIYCQSLNSRIAGPDNNLKQVDGSPAVTQFVTTRFGNVLGSNGSVIPIFEKQIKRGGPVTVTHPDIIRFFMLIPEACRLVLEAGTLGHGGEIFVFDMGEPVRIADLARRMINLMGAKKVQIVYSGLREGEKLYEEVLSQNEDDKPTIHPKIKVAAVREYDYDLALKNEEELYDLSFGYDDMAIVKKMKEIVPEYKSKNSKYEVLD